MHSDTSPPSPTRGVLGRVFPHVRAGVVLAVIVVCLVASLPMPGPATSRTLRDDAAKAELDTWVGILGQLGWQTDREQLGEQVLAVGRVSRQAKSAVTTPFNQLFRITASWQGWGLFAYPDTHPHGLRIEARRAQGWSTLYDSRVPEHRWSADILHYRRVRAMYNPGIRPPGTYGHFVDWVAARAFAEDPTVVSVRVGLVRRRTLLPGEVVDLPDERTRFRKIRHRPTPRADPL